ncbi:MAG TPA: phosphoglucomutase (alpha-D-glucose-1,6-bisphosphate-dependent) [Bryobacteraceae bacterium]|nr:phosphoglucomutase (alpha-D-glucose-1,6-bisphosphate-dependent) [Bryobacteraceae bacterium]
MPLHPLAGKPAPQDVLIDVAALEDNYFHNQPDPGNPLQRVSFGTSGHRGTSGNGTFTEAHILAITQAICDYRSSNGIGGPVFLGKDTHALSHVAQQTAIEVLAGNGVATYVQKDDGPTPTPVISRAIIRYNRAQPINLADGIVISPSHNPPADGGFKYNPTNGGPAESDVTAWIQNRANELLAGKNRAVRRTAYGTYLTAHDYITPYVEDLKDVIDMDAIQGANLNLGVDPLGGASLHYWAPIAARYGLKIENVNPKLDPTFSFMTLDHDGQIRMDCSSPYAMAGLVSLKDRFDVAFATDPDADRHGIVVPSAGLLNPNHYLAVAINYLVKHRSNWPQFASVGKTLVSSSIIDRVVNASGRPLAEVPVGFKWFAGGLSDGSYCFGGEESAGASFLERNGLVWTTDKDGLLLDLLAAEITAVTGRDPGQHYQALTEEYGAPVYTRIDVPTTPEQKQRLSKLNAETMTAKTLAGDPVSSILTHAPANNAAIGGVKVNTRNGWFAARPSGTENIYKIYAESFQGPDHLAQIVAQAQEIVTAAVGG